MEKKQITEFQKTVWNFYNKSDRNFPWRQTQNPYYILVSEIMLQQTQAPRVVAFYERWIQHFPDFSTLAKAKFSEIYPLWQGLGYNRRALALQKLAVVVTEKYQGALPTDLALLQELPGIGPYTARAVAIFSFNRSLTCIETNIRRVFIHHFFPEAEVISDQEILPLLELALPQKKSREWHWALMDYGAHLKSSVKNPNRRAKNYTVQSKFEGSLRQIRGVILRTLASENMPAAKLAKIIDKDSKKVKNVLAALKKEGLVKQNKTVYSLG